MTKVRIIGYAGGEKRGYNLCSGAGKENLKKVLALVLAFACAFTMFAGAAFTDAADINADNADAVDLLTTLNII